MGFAARDQRDDDSDGFTIIELVVALGLGMFMFSALASMLLGATKIVSIQKSRTQANDLATIGIEDLQRLNYDAMGLCTAPPGPTPSDMTDTVLLPNCSSPTKYGPCAAGAAPAGAVPDESYTCTLRNIAYEIRRFVAYGDISHSVKRLAVVVEWDDRGGRHQVSQQSSLRIPSRAALIGAAPPSFNAAGTTVSGPVTLNAGGRNSSSISLNAQVSGLAAGASSTTGDSVIAVFQTVGPGGR
jgi:type II secretory pathway pseudopilin PulG